MSAHGRRDDHQLADQRLHQARLLGDADADHRDEMIADGVEAHEVRHDAGEHEADAVDGQQAARRGASCSSLCVAGMITW